MHYCAEDPSSPWAFHHQDEGDHDNDRDRPRTCFSFFRSSHVSVMFDIPEGMHPSHHDTADVDREPWLPRQVMSGLRNPSLGCSWDRSISRFRMLAVRCGEGLREMEDTVESGGRSR